MLLRDFKRWHSKHFLVSSLTVNLLNLTEVKIAVSLMRNLFLYLLVNNNTSAYRYSENRGGLHQKILRHGREKCQISFMQIMSCEFLDFARESESSFWKGKINKLKLFRRQDCPTANRTGVHADKIYWSCSVFITVTVWNHSFSWANQYNSRIFFNPH